MPYTLRSQIMPRCSRATDVSVMPYAAMAANGAAWCTYGALGYDLTIMAPNASGLLFGTYYCHQFYVSQS